MIIYIYFDNLSTEDINIFINSKQNLNEYNKLLLTNLHKTLILNINKEYKILI